MSERMEPSKIKAEAEAKVERMEADFWADYNKVDDMAGNIRSGLKRAAIISAVVGAIVVAAFVLF